MISCWLITHAVMDMRILTMMPDMRLFFFTMEFWREGQGGIQAGLWKYHGRALSAFGKN